MRRLFGLFLLAMLALFAYALMEAWPNDHYVGPVAWYTLIVLGKISSALRMGNTMIGAVTVVLGYMMFVGAYGLWVLSTPQPAYTESFTQMMRRYPIAPLGVKIAVPAIYAFGAITCVGIIWFLWF